MNKQILRIALPSIVSNVTVPLLSLVDTAIVGHLGAADYIAAVALGGTLFSTVYWLFGFLRMGTGGLTAQAFGRGEQDAAARTLVRSLLLGALVGLCLIAVQPLVLSAYLKSVEVSADVAGLVRIYVDCLIWGAPAMMMLYGLSGWFLGMQNARFPMVVAIVQNVVNVAASLGLVVGLRWKVEGVACGTLVAQYSGVVLALVLLRMRYGKLFTRQSLRGVMQRAHLMEFFRINRDIFLRTFLLVAVTLCFTVFGTQLGPLALAANAILMQFFLFFSYIMDGFAYAGEALGGRFVGEGNRADFLRLARRLLLVGVGFAVAFGVVYLLFGDAILRLLTDQQAVVEQATALLPFIAVVPLAGFAAFVFDGLFVGATASREMLLSMLVAAVAFFACHALAPHSGAWLWGAFILYLALRGAVQATMLRGILRRKIWDNTK